MCFANCLVLKFSTYERESLVSTIGSYKRFRKSTRVRALVGSDTPVTSNPTKKCLVPLRRLPLSFHLDSTYLTCISLLPSCIPSIRNPDRERASNHIDMYSLENMFQHLYTYMYLYRIMWDLFVLEYVLSILRLRFLQYKLTYNR